MDHYHELESNIKDSVLFQIRMLFHLCTVSLMFRTIEKTAILHITEHDITVTMVLIVTNKGMLIVVTQQVPVATPISLKHPTHSTHVFSY